MKKNAVYPVMLAGFVFLLFTACTRPVPENMVLIQGGVFLMGSPASDPDFLEMEGPQHEVTVNSFYIGMYAVTQNEYEEVMGINPGNSGSENLPVASISWFDAIAFCNAMSRRERLKPAYIVNGKEVLWNKKANGYRLPTEAEWEYACRAETVTRFSTGDNITTEQARFMADIPVAVGSFPPNPWGLYDMHGNVYEWCWDRYGTYGTEPLDNPDGAESGDFRVIRGGGAASLERHLRSAVRSRVEPDLKNSNLGFRIAKNSKKP